MSVYIFDLRALDKPTHTTPARQGGKPRPHYSTNATLRKRRAAAREAGGIGRIVLHQWAAEVRPSRRQSEDLLTAESVASDDAGDLVESTESLMLACRAAGVFVDGRSRGIGGAPYHISVSATRRGSGVVALVWPRSEHTFHAGTENARSIGVGVMGLFERDEEGADRPGLPDALAWALALAAGMVRGDDADAHLDSATPVPSAPGSDGWRMDRPPPLPEGPPVLLATHSQSDRKPADPGLYVVRHGVAPAAAAGLVRVEPEWSTGKGQHWPASWRRALASV